MYPADTILNRAITWARYYSGIRQQNSSLVPIRCDPIQWKYPEPEWICLNVDGEVSIVTGTGSIGGLLRDYAGSWIFNFQKGIGKCNPLQWKHPKSGWIYLNVDEAVSTVSHWIYWWLAARLCWIMDFRFSKRDMEIQFPFARAIIKLRQRGWVIDIIWVARHGNQATDTLTKTADSSTLDVIHLHSSSEYLRPFLSHDAHSTSIGHT
ncbi:hypothetical protein V6N11_081549 [Hibiscus sabdariffa]|uniref:RNase H type-1 domain-containing protein n=1 Tax=Hibiscus sabdariffa TaxID=183260 RepID=A0ABR2AAF4_9ROSI